MYIARIRLQNYRVYEDPLELDLPAGLVGIYGPNGAGKSTLLEAILFALFGRARTGRQEIRSAGTGGECVAEVTFEHEGHLYEVRRSLSGANHTVRARAVADGLHVAEGATDVTRYVRSVLGMDDAAFRASVFAEQKQVAAFSAQTPERRRELVLGLLGITPVDRARDLARADARTRRTAYEAARNALGDLDALRTALETAAAAEEAAAAALGAAEAARAAAETAAAGAAAELERLEALGRSYDELVAEGKSARARLEAAAEAVERLRAEIAELEPLTDELAAAQAAAGGLAEATARLEALERLAAAEARLAEAEARVPPPPEIDLAEAEAATAAAREASAAAREAAAAAEAEWQAAAAEVARAREAVERASELSGEAACPLCGQALGDAFEAVQRHRAAELAAAEARQAEVAARRRELAAAVRRAATAEREAEGALRAAQAAHRDRAAAQAAAEEAAAAVAAARAAVDPPPAAGEREALAAAVASKRQAERRAAELAGRLQRLERARGELAEQERRRQEAEGEVAALLEKVRALGFDRAARDAARAEAARAAAELQAARDTETAARVAHADAAARADAARAALADAEAQRARVEALGREAAELERTAALLGAFRNELVASVGPALSAHAASLFADLTDGEYEGLELDGDTYEIRLVDKGIAYGLDRFSGSETDLANLAVRVAISEHIRLQSGGQVGLLVLDEVFGPLDAERKERMLAALERLRSRFRQVLVVTHDVEVKDRLPSAVEVQKLPGRRATARLAA